MFDILDPATPAAVGSIIIIDIVLSDDNAIVIGMAVSGLPDKLRKRTIIIDLTLADGILLLWVCWRMWREMHDARIERQRQDQGRLDCPSRPVTTLRQALILIVVADVLMSLDNVWRLPAPPKTTSTC